MEHEEHDQHLRRVLVQSAQEPAAGHFGLDVIDAFPGRLRAWTVSHPEKQPRDKLDGNAEGHNAAPHITPARATRYVFAERRARPGSKTGALIKPGENG